MVEKRETKLKIAFDTSCVIAFFLSRNNTYFVDVINPINLEKYEIFVSLKLMLELFTKIQSKIEKNKFKRTLEEIEKFTTWYMQISHFCIIEENEIQDSFCRDANDFFILSLADKCNLDFVLTYDLDLLEIGQYKNTKFVRPGDFHTFLVG